MVENRGSFIELYKGGKKIKEVKEMAESMGQTQKQTVGYIDEAERIIARLESCISLLSDILGHDPGDSEEKAEFPSAPAYRLERYLTDMESLADRILEGMQELSSLY